MLVLSDSAAAMFYVNKQRGADVPINKVMPRDNPLWNFCVASSITSKLLTFQEFKIHWRPPEQAICRSSRVVFSIRCVQVHFPAWGIFPSGTVCNKRKQKNKTFCSQAGHSLDSLTDASPTLVKRADVCLPSSSAAAQSLIQSQARFCFYSDSILLWITTGFFYKPHIHKISKGLAQIIPAGS